MSREAKRQRQREARERQKAARRGSADAGGRVQAGAESDVSAPPEQRPKAIGLRGLRFNLPAELPTGADPIVVLPKLRTAYPSMEPVYDFLSVMLGPEYARLLLALDRQQVSQADLSELVILIYARYGVVDLGAVA
jgi:hypothetical protein